MATSQVNSALIRSSSTIAEMIRRDSEKLPVQAAGWIFVSSVWTTSALNGLTWIYPM